MLSGHFTKEGKEVQPDYFALFEEYTLEQSEGKVTVFPHGCDLLLGASLQDERSLPTPYIP